MFACRPSNSHDPLRSPGARRRSVVISRLLYLLVILSVFAAMALSTRGESADQVAAQAKATGYVTDLAGVLSQAGKDQISGLCTEVAQKTQAEIAVIAIKSLDERPIEEYARELYERLGLGPKGLGRGVLILFAINDHRDRIEVGYGLEAILPDGKNGSFLREIAPDLRAANYDAALLLVTRRVADVIAADKGVTLSGAPVTAPSAPGSGEGLPSAIGSVLTLIIFIFVFGGFLGPILWAIFGRPRTTGRGGRWIGGPAIGGWGGGGFGGGWSGGGGGGFGGFGGGGFGGGFGGGGGGASGSW